MSDVVLYADNKTKSIQTFLATTEYRRKKQLAYNKKHNITPKSVKRAVESSLSYKPGRSRKEAAIINDAGGDFDVVETIKELEQEMIKAAENLEFEKAALLRDQLQELKRATGDEPAPKPQTKTSYRKSKRRKRTVE